jgi:uncharacterized membrane protein
VTSILYTAVKKQIKKGKTQDPETAKYPNSLIRRPRSLEETNEIQIDLQNEFKIEFTKKESTASLREYVFSSKALWYWLTILLAATSSIAIFVIPENAVPLIYLRWGFGVIFVLFLPGFVFIKTLFPTNVPFKTSSESMDTLERVVLSLGMSLILTPMVGLILDYTPWGVRLTSITLSLLTLTVFLATAAVFRELKQDKVEKGEISVKQHVL